MFAIIGYVIAFGCVFGVYILHGGNVDVLAKALPLEMATIGGSALGALVIQSPQGVKSHHRQSWRLPLKGEAEQSPVHGLVGLAL